MAGKKFDSSKFARHLRGVITDNEDDPLVTGPAAEGLILAFEGLTSEEGRFLSQRKSLLFRIFALLLELIAYPQPTLLENLWAHTSPIILACSREGIHHEAHQQMVSSP